MCLFRFPYFNYLTSSSKCQAQTLKLKSCENSLDFSSTWINNEVVKAPGTKRKSNPSDPLNDILLWLDKATGDHIPVLSMIADDQTGPFRTLVACNEYVMFGHTLGENPNPITETIKVNGIEWSLGCVDYDTQKPHYDNGGNLVPYPKWERHVPRGTGSDIVSVKFNPKLVIQSIEKIFKQYGLRRKNHLACGIRFTLSKPGIIQLSLNRSHRRDFDNRGLEPLRVNVPVELSGRDFNEVAFNGYMLKDALSIFKEPVYLIQSQARYGRPALIDTCPCGSRRTTWSVILPMNLEA